MYSLQGSYVRLKCLEGGVLVSLVLKGVPHVAFYFNVQIVCFILCFTEMHVSPGAAYTWVIDYHCAQCHPSLYCFWLYSQLHSIPS